jgi:uncharacterized protein (DUF433 family)
LAVWRENAMNEPRIIDRGRGPEIAGSRITVYDVMDYHKTGWHPTEIAKLFHLTPRQIEVAIEYIHDHKDEVLKAYERILERDARGNPPELQAKLDAGHEQFLAMVEARRNAKMVENPDAGDSPGH